MDGLKLNLQQAGVANIQNNFYNEWIHNHYVIGAKCTAESTFSKHEGPCMILSAQNIDPEDNNVGEYG